MFGLLVASSSVGALDKSAADKHYVEESFSTDPEEDEIILNEKNPRPEYSQTEDTATYGDFRLHEIIPRGEQRCSQGTYTYKNDAYQVCNAGCRCERYRYIKCGSSKKAV